MSEQINQQLKQSLIWRGLYFVLSFATTIIVSRVLQAEASGEFSYLLTALTLLVFIFSFNLDTAITYYISAKIISPQKLFIAGLFIAGLFLIFINLTVNNNIYLKFINFKILQIDVIQSSIYYLFGMLLLTFSTGVLNGLRDFKTPSAILIILNSIYIIAISYRYFTHNSIEIVHDFCFLTMIAGILIATICFVKTKIWSQFEMPGLKDFSKIYRYAFFIMLSNIVFFLVYKLDFYFVNTWTHSKFELGNYVQASKFAQILLVVPQILATTIFPQISSNENRETIKANIDKLIRLYIFIFSCIFILGITGGRWFLPFMFGQSFSKMWLPTLLLIPGILGLAISNLYSAYFNGTKQNGINLIGAVVALAIMVILSLILKQNYTINKAALISTVAYLSEFSLMGFFYYRQMGEFKLKELIAFRVDDFKWIKQLLKS